jgi:molybdenum cofactor guanylyltransferase
MQPRFLSISGFVLAGGESRRMGRAKDQLEVGGEKMLDRQIRLLRAVARSIVVLGPPERLGRQNVPVIADDLPRLGPLGGIHTALASTRTEYNLFLGCDMPFMTSEFLRYLCRIALASRADVTVPESHGRRMQPTCAIYRRRARGVISVKVEACDLRVRGFFPRVECRVLSWTEIARHGFHPRIFDNMNTPDDYEAAKRRLEPKLQITNYK